ncbi:MAG: zinc-dependent dehydrogenase [Spirochaetales bacterium]|nr:zinc-dependent dehydrogenase [Spirochaetales bacterium]
MRVAMYYNNNDVRLEEMDKPKIGAGEMLVKVAASGICGSDVLEWYRLKKAPLVLGHEIAGEVVETGEGVTEFKPGDRVFVNHHVPCNTCRYCRAGKHTVCETLHTTNFHPGGFSEYIRIPPINVERGTFLLPDNVSYEEGSFVEPLACVVRGQRIAGLKPEQSVLILGSGVSGLLHLICARAQGTGAVVTTDVVPFRLEMARRLGAAAVIDAASDVPARYRALNDGRGADLVIVCTGAFPAFKQALDSVDRGGTILCFATTTPDIDLPLPINDFWRNGITVLPSYANSPYDAEVVIRMLSNRLIDVVPTITHRLPLEKTGEGFKLMSRPGDSMKVIIEPHRNE